MISIGLGIALFIELAIAVLGSGLKGIDSEGAAYQAGFGSPGEIGELLLTRYLLAFEVASFLLLVAAVGAVILARRRQGLEPAGTVAVSDLFSTTEATGTIGPESQGTMLEAGGSPKR